MVTTPLSVRRMIATQVPPGRATGEPSPSPSPAPVASGIAETTRVPAHRGPRRHGVVVGLALLATGLSSCTFAPPKQETGTDASEQSTDASGSPSQAPVPDPDPDATGAGQELPIDAGALVERFGIEVRAGTVHPPRTNIAVAVGDTIELAVMTDVGGTLRSADLETTRDLPAGEETVVPLTVKRTGRFEVFLDGVLISSSKIID